MAYRILIELFFFLLPFAAFGLYRLLVADAEADGRKAWPVHILFAAGAVLAALVWLFFILREDKERGICQVPARLVDGILVPAQQIPCDQDITGLGIPLDEDPGGEAHGVTPDRRDPSDDIAAEAPEREPIEANDEQ